MDFWVSCNFKTTIFPIQSLVLQLSPLNLTILCNLNKLAENLLTLLLMNVTSNWLNCVNFGVSDEQGKSFGIDYAEKNILCVRTVIQLSVEGSTNYINLTKHFSNSHD